MLYNLIGDIHGRDAWRQLVREDAVNVFLGDYLNPYGPKGKDKGIQLAGVLLSHFHTFT